MLPANKSIILHYNALELPMWKKMIFFICKFEQKIANTIKPAGSVVSEMLRLLKVFLSIESTVEISVLSIYSMSGLLKEWQEDIDSSIETDIPSDLLGETSILIETGTMTVATVGGSSFLCGLEKTDAVVDLTLGK